MDIADKYTQAYRELSQEVHDAGLIQRRYWLSWAMIVGWTLTLAALIVLVFILGVTWFQLLMAAGIGAVMAQLGLLAHDAAHRQLFASRRWNEWTARIIACLLVGISYGWWMNKHNSHHGYPNQVGKDPDIDSRVLAFTPEATDRRTGLRAKLAKRQGWFFIPLLFLEGLNLQAQSLKMLLTKPKVPYRVPETLMILVRHTAYFVLIFTILPLGMAFTSFGLQVGFFGLLLGGAFALNHIGRPTVAADMRIDFLHRQVVMSRNIKDGPFVRFFMGGLQYQIEHHLFPIAPRASLPAVQSIVRKYCSRYDIPYEERHVAEASRTVLAYLNQVGLKHRDAFTCPLVQRYRI